MFHILSMKSAHLNKIMCRNSYMGLLGLIFMSNNSLLFQVSLSIGSIGISFLFLIILTVFLLFLIDLFLIII